MRKQCARFQFAWLLSASFRIDEKKLKTGIFFYSNFLTFGIYGKSQPNSGATNCVRGNI